MPPEYPFISHQVRPDTLILENFQYSSGVESRRMIGDTRRFFPKETGSRFIGGIGITARSVQESERICPGFTEIVMDEKGKIVILGNGFSEQGILAAERYTSGIAKEQPVIVDVIDYRAMLEDLVTLQDTHRSEEVEFNYSVELERVRKICAYADSGSLVLANYEIGKGNPPGEAMNADLCINIYGPANETLREQLKLLRIGGKLISANAPEVPDDIKADYKVATIPFDTNISSTLIKRIR